MDKRYEVCVRHGLFLRSFRTAVAARLVLVALFGPAKDILALGTAVLNVGTGASFWCTGTMQRRHPGLGLRCHQSLLRNPASRQGSSVRCHVSSSEESERVHLVATVANWGQWDIGKLAQLSLEPAESIQFVTQCQNAVLVVKNKRRGTDSKQTNRQCRNCLERLFEYSNRDLLFQQW
jgi:hypothetical protein